MLITNPFAYPCFVFIHELFRQWFGDLFVVINGGLDLIFNLYLCPHVFVQFLAIFVDVFVRFCIEAHYMVYLWQLTEA